MLVVLPTQVWKILLQGCFNTHKEILQGFDVIQAATKAGLGEVLEILWLKAKFCKFFCIHHPVTGGVKTSEAESTRFFNSFQLLLKS